jgi:hypothetical protein
MADVKPPRLAAGESETLLALLRYQRQSLARKVTGLDEADASGSPVASGTTLVWLVAHMARAEITWVLERFAGLDPSTTGEPADGTLAAALAFYRATWSRVDDVVASAGLADLCRRPDAEPNVNLRWVLMHLLEETARHAGHADILAELVDGRSGR